LISLVALADENNGSSDVRQTYRIKPGPPLAAATPRDRVTLRNQLRAAEHMLRERGIVD